MSEVDFLSKYQAATKRNYVERVAVHDKAQCATVAKQWGAHYWDGERQFGYGGHYYDGRWLPVAQDIAKHYGLKAGDRVLDVGCGKAFLIYELSRVVPGIGVWGIDISDYALDHANEEVKPLLTHGYADDLPYASDSFDLVLSLNTLHNLGIDKLCSAVSEIERVGKKHKWICVESYRNEREKANLLYWQLTCESFHYPEGWQWLYREWGYTGDYGFIYFED